MARVAINTSTAGRTHIPTPGVSASFVPGSRAAPKRTRIKPAQGQRDYGKEGPAQSSFGLTGVTSRS